MTKLRSPSEIAAFQLRTKWASLARPKQLRPNKPHNLWLILAGRGWGKTRTGAQDLAAYALSNPNVTCAVVAPTHGDLRRVCFNGISGLMSIIPKECFAQSRDFKGYSSSFSEIRLFNGSKIIGYAAIDPDRLRGSQFHRAWCDELAAWRYPEAFDQLMFGLRLGKNPQAIITTTPKPTPIIRKLIEREDCYVTRGNTFENSDNLADSALDMLKDRYEGTQLGRQELYAEIIDNVDGALWSLGMIDKCRMSMNAEINLSQIVVAIDPAVTSNKNSDETGIVVVGKNDNNQYFVLDDLSGKMTTESWGKKAVQAFYSWEADRIVAEVNNGGDLVESLLRGIDRNIPYRSVRASRGKIMRAEPISALYERNLVYHVGNFSQLESQMLSFDGTVKPSPDRLDALVWGLTELSKSSGSATWRIS